MKILIATPLFPPDIGGPATYAKILNKDLPKWGILVEILAFREVRSLPKIVRHFAYFLRCLGKGRDCDLIYALDSVSVGFPAMLAAKLTGKRFILKVVGDFAWEMEMQSEKQKTQNESQPFLTLEEFQFGKYRLLTEVRRKIERFVAKRAEWVIVPSEYLKKIILMWGVPEEKIKVIYNALEVPPVLPSKGAVRQELGISVDEKIILSAGRLVPWKGFAKLIEAFAEIAENYSKAKLFIAGSGPEEENLKRKAKSAKLEDKIQFLGLLPQGELHKYITAADVFVLNTGYEGFSHLLLEVMGLGTPIITTSVGGNREIIKSGENGLFVGYNNKEEITEAIIRLLNDESLSCRLAQKARSIVTKFSLETMIGNTIEMLKS